MTDVVNDKTVELDVPVRPSLRDATDEQLVQDRNGSFEPQLVRKRQRRSMIW
jgi:hypothetical protein